MNILISRHDKIGDFVVTLPMFKVLKEQRPELKLIALVSKINYDFAKNIDFIDDVILYDKNNLSKTLEDIKDEKIDTSISAFIDTNLGKLLFKSNIKKRIAPATKLAQFFFNKRVKQRRSRVEKKEFEYNLDLLKAFDESISLSYSYPLLEFSAFESNRIFNEFKREHKIVEKNRLVAFHPGSGGSTDGNLILEDYLKLAKKVSKIDDIEVIFTFGPDDLKLKEELEKKVDFDAVIYESKGALIDFCKLLSFFELFVSTSTGPMHLASCSNIKTVSFFGEKLVSTPKRWASISQEKFQNNFIVHENYTNELYQEIEDRVLEVLKIDEK
ncbi:MAG: heptosyltransferase [Arcobacter sp.]|nr:MAG: heptosyltransferase [Arcobacter sp.]